MAFTTGTATDYHDLMDKFRLWMTGTAGWTELRWSNPAGISSEWDLSLQGPGGGPERRVFAHLRSYSIPTDNVYSIRLDASVGWDSGEEDWLSQQGSTGKRIYLNLWQNPIDYWFFANDRHFKIVCKMSTIYTCAYVGFFLPWGTPAQYPFPLFVAGDWGLATVYNTVSAARRFFPDAGGSSIESGGWVRTPYGIWVPVLNHDYDVANDSAYNGEATRVNIWPWHPGKSSQSSSLYAWCGNHAGQNGGGSYDSLVPTAQGERLITPTILIETRSQQLGTLDGVYAPLGGGLTTEQAIVAGGKNLRAFQNIARSSANDFVLLEEI